MNELIENTKDSFLKYKNSKIVSALLIHKSDLYWIFFASSFVNVLVLTPMLYMLQIFDRIFISKSEITLLTISMVILFFYFISAFSNYIRSRIALSLGLA